MTVNTTSITSGPYTGNNIVDVFSYTFRAEAKTDIQVFETTDAGVETTLAVDTDYTVAGLSTDGGGTITRVAGALPTDYTWYIRSNYALTQETSFESQGAFLPEIHELAMDKLTLLMQQQLELANRSFYVSPSFIGAIDLQLPDPEALKLLRWNV